MSELIRFLSDPNVAYIFIALGLLAILSEILHPGTIIMGLLGTIGIVLGIVGLGHLPLSWGGILLLGLAAVLFTVELVTSTAGALALVAIISFAAGSLLLFETPPGQTTVAVNPWLIGLTAAVQAAFFLVLVREVQKSRKAPVTMGVEALRTSPAEAVSRLNPRGKVRINGEVWTAELLESSATVEAGQPVEVADVDGVILKVRAIPKNQPNEQANWSKSGWEQTNI